MTKGKTLKRFFSAREAESGSTQMRHYAVVCVSPSCNVVWFCQWVNASAVGLKAGRGPSSVDKSMNPIYWVLTNFAFVHLGGNYNSFLCDQSQNVNSNESHKPKPNSEMNNVVFGVW